MWSADVTYLPVARSFCYLTAVMDWADRRVLSWRPSNTPDASFCIETLAEGLSKREIIRCLKHYVAREVFRALASP